MLIVLSFTLGAFLGQESAFDGSPEPQESGKQQNESDLLLSEVAMDGLFHQSELKLFKAKAVVELLKSHDIRAEFELHAGSSDTPSIEAALAQAVTLSRHLQREGVPANALAVYAVEAEQEKGAVMRLFKIRGKRAREQ